MAEIPLMHNIAQVLNIIANKSNKTDYEIFLFKSCSLCIDYDFIIPEINKLCKRYLKKSKEENYQYVKEFIENIKKANFLISSGQTITGKTITSKTKKDSGKQLYDSIVDAGTKYLNNKIMSKNEKGLHNPIYPHPIYTNTNPKNKPMTEEDKLQFLNKWFSTDKDMQKILQQEEKALMKKKKTSFEKNFSLNFSIPYIKEHEVSSKCFKIAIAINNLINNKKYDEAIIKVEKLYEELNSLENTGFFPKEKELYEWCKYYIECYYSTHNIDKEKIDITKQQLEYPPKVNEYNYYYKTIENITNLLKSNKKGEANVEIIKLQNELTPSPKKVFILEEKEVYKWCNKYLGNMQEVTQSKHQEDIANQQINQSINKKQQEIIEWCNFYLVPEAAKYVEQMLKNNQYTEATEYIEQQIKEGNSNKYFLGQMVDTQQVVKELNHGKWGQPYPNPNKVIEKWKTYLDETKMYIEGKPYSYYAGLTYEQKCQVLQELKGKPALSDAHKQLCEQLSADILEEINKHLTDKVLDNMTTSSQEVLDNIVENAKKGSITNILPDDKIKKAIDWKKFDEETTKKADKMVDDIKKNVQTMPIEDIIKTIENQTKKENKKLKKLSKCLYPTPPEIKEGEEILVPTFEVCNTPVNVTKNPKKYIKKKLSKKDIGNILTDAIVSDKKLAKKILELDPQKTQLPKTRRLQRLSDQELNVIKFSIQLCLANIQIPNTSDEKIIIALTKEIEIEEALRLENGEQECSQIKSNKNSKKTKQL